MKHRIAHIVLLLMVVGKLTAQITISGIVSDGRESLAGVNVFIVGTIDGCLTDSLGRFLFTTTQTGEVTLKASSIGFEDFIQTEDVNQLHDLTILMKERATTIDEVVVTASSFSFGKSDNFKTMDALDIVMAGNSCGDIVAALQTLPGTQMVGENGKLYVRGGESDECQTFVNGMHVLVPYSTQTENSAVRGRFSPFLFKGINFSLGGYSGEYGQALSSVLPMETTDAATSDKFGVSASLVDWNVGGTKAYHNSSLSFNAALTSMGLYDKLFAERFDFSRPYRKLSGETQYKKEFSASNVLKSYVGYDLTSVGQRIEGRCLSLKEHNVYANVTHRAAMGQGYTFFTGIANSSVFCDVDDARMAGDHYHNFRNEIHLKAEVRKICSEVLKMSAGVEDYIRNSSLRYDTYRYQLDYNILAAHVDAQWRVIPQVFLNMSARAEKFRMRNSGMVESDWQIMPRATLSYIPNKHLQLSLVTGRYSQTASDDYLAQSRNLLGQSIADHAILSMQYKSQSTFLRIEPYWKKYRRLPLLENGLYQPHGYGTSKGVDIFVEDHSIIKNLTTTLSYSYNDSERLYLDYTEVRTLDYASRHNLRLTAKYAVGKFVVGLADSYASGRRFPTGQTPHYHSVDVNLTYLLSPKVIVYSSLNNIFGRTNIFRYNANGSPVVPSRDRFLYIGIFVSLKNNKAYDISNF
ncbi:MAG: TonB-dependent receptor [Bacteroidaceae bacterium]|nr:TonB-dependent receptor [Bacteroidaceae bacterium]